jgi:YYY domain-containing protein
MADILIWYGLILLIGVVALPYSFWIFRRLPDKGYGLSKPLGLLLVGLLAWWIGSLKLLPFDGLTCWIALLVLGVAGNVLLFASPRLSGEIFDWFRQKRNWLVVLGAEFVFASAAAFMINSRSFFPELDKSEKFFDLAFIQAIAVSPTLPAPDPWFYGQPMNYYYGGQLLMAVLVKMTGLEASIAYNIMMGLVFALGAVASYSLAGNLVGLVRNKLSTSSELRATSSEPEKTVSYQPSASNPEQSEAPTHPSSFINHPSKDPHPLFPVGYGLLGAAFLMWLGNFYPVRQALRNGFLPWGDKNFPFWVEWPASARMIYDPMPDGRMLDILTEYPIYSYLNGDLHAHLLGAPFVLLAISFILHLFSRPVGHKFNWRAAAEMIPGGLFIGALYFINGGDFPIYAGLTAVALLYLESRKQKNLWQIGQRWFIQMAVMGASLYVFYFFYLNKFTGMLRGKPAAEVADVPLLGFLSRYLGWISWPKTFLGEYVMMFGLFLFAIVTFMGLKLFLRAQKERRTKLEALPGWARLLVRICGVGFLWLGAWSLSITFSDWSRSDLKLESVVLPVICLSAAAWTLVPRAWDTLRQYPQTAIESMVGLVLLGVGPLIDMEMLGPATMLTYWALRLLIIEWRLDNENRLDAFVLLLVFTAGALTLFCEISYVRDIYANRFNTMFKFWYQLWVMFGFAGVYSVYRVVRWNLSAEAETYAVMLPEKAPSRPKILPKAVNPFVFLMKSEPTPQVAGNAPQVGSADAGTPTSTEEVNVTTPEVKPAAKPTRQKMRGWQILWASLLAYLMILTLPVATLGYAQATGNYQNFRHGLNGEKWYEGWAPAEYKAMVWLRDYTRNNAERRGIVLEANGMNYSWANRISTFTGLPTIVGWPFHELQWRGYLDEKVIWEAWLDMSRIYETTDRQMAQEMLKRHNVRYVFVGQVENGSRSFNPDNSQPKQYSAEALAKFGEFMQVLYADVENNVYIYAFN